MKVLILSCNTGQGHNSAGRAVKYELEKNGVYCEMLDALAFDSERVSKMVSNIHSKCAVRAPGVYAVGYEMAEKISRSGASPSVCYLANMKYAEELYEYIDDGGFDTIVMPHVFPSEALTRIRKKHGGALTTYFISTDYSYPPFLCDTKLDYYFIPHASLVSEFSRYIPKSLLVPTGIPVSRAFSEKTDKAEARRALGIPADKRAVLIMTGSMGYGQTAELAECLTAQTGDDTVFFILGGRNESLKEYLRKTYSDDSRVTVVDFTTEVSLYMDACDVLFTKPGGLSSTEAAVKGIPTVLTKPIPGWEEDNIKFFTSNGLARHGKTPEEMCSAALELLNDSAAADKMVAAQHKTVNGDAADDICSFIMQNENALR
jgi:processive 1,2-diacylglycerol beta-glucosyltransferase